MNTLKKTIWFDTNSEPQKSYIWYRGEGKFYEYSGGNWVLTYDLANTPTQSELESIADKLSDGSEETVDANIGSILNALSDKIEGILDLIPEQQTESTILEIEIPLAGFEDKTKEESAQLLGITVDEFEYLRNGLILGVLDRGALYLVIKPNEDEVFFINGNESDGVNTKYHLIYNPVNRLFSFNEI